MHDSSNTSFLQKHALVPGQSFWGTKEQSPGRDSSGGHSGGGGGGGSYPGGGGGKPGKAKQSQSNQQKKKALGNKYTPDNNNPQQTGMPDGEHPDQKLLSGSGQKPSPPKKTPSPHGRTPNWAKKVQNEHTPGQVNSRTGPAT